MWSTHRAHKLVLLIQGADVARVLVVLDDVVVVASPLAGCRRRRPRSPEGGRQASPQRLARQVLHGVHREFTPICTKRHAEVRSGGVEEGKRITNQIIAEGWLRVTRLQQQTAGRVERREAAYFVFSRSEAVCFSTRHKVAKLYRNSRV